MVSLAKLKPEDSQLLCKHQLKEEFLTRLNCGFWLCREWPLILGQSSGVLFNCSSVNRVLSFKVTASRRNVWLATRPQCLLPMHLHWRSFGCCCRRGGRSCCCSRRCAIRSGCRRSSLPCTWERNFKLHHWSHANSETYVKSRHLTKPCVTGSYLLQKCFCGLACELATALDCWFQFGSHQDQSDYAMTGKNPISNRLIPAVGWNR